MGSGKGKTRRAKSSVASPSELPDVVRDLFEEMDGQRFSDYNDFESEVRSRFAAHRAKMPLSYAPKQAIAWARENNWVVESGNKLLVQVAPLEPAAPPKPEPTLPVLDDVQAVQF